MPPSPGRSSSDPSISQPLVSHRRGRIAKPLAKDAGVGRRAVRAAVRLGQGLVFHDAFLAAPAMAFHFFLSLLPALVFMGYVVANVAERRGTDVVLGPLLSNLPETAELVVKREVQHLATASTLGPASAITFFWLASGGMHGLMNAVETVVGAPRRPWWKKRLFALGWVVAGLVVVVLTSLAMVEWRGEAASAAPDVVTPTSAVTKDRTSVAAADKRAIPPPAHVGKSSATAALAEGRSRGPSASAPSGGASSQPKASSPRRPRLLRTGLQRAYALTFASVLSVVGLSFFYRFAVTHSKKLKRRVVPGAVVAVLLWLIISWAFGFYVSTLAGYAVYYGSLAAVAVLLMWLWLTSLALLIGAELNAQLEGLRD